MSHPDPWQAAYLPNGYAATVCITPDGGRVLWLLANRGHIKDGDEFGCSCQRCAPHEHPDRPIPPRMTAALDRPTQPRCGRPRTDGQPCRTLVARDGLACHWHRTSNRGATQ